MLPELQTYLRIALRSIGHRAELAGLELLEARDHLVAVLLLLVGAATLVLLTGGVVTFFVTAAFWDTAYRLHAIGALGLLYLLAAALCWLRVRRLMAAFQPFAQTKEQLRKDAACVQLLMNSSGSR